ncbi:hypothetical protein EYF80_011261 [Liparis tanakae]|uniref:Uncharacterized protein n=1 Tax=Liparis tanakae TaxID=230148 RepID=A0A4Z2IL84_9TELE|nr:hypothetical protein EYF80_011261 [Liparis tanakae]
MTMEVRNNEPFQKFNSPDHWCARQPRFLASPPRPPPFAKASAGLAASRGDEKTPVIKAIALRSDPIEKRVRTEPLGAVSNMAGSGSSRVKSGEGWGDGKKKGSSAAFYAGHRSSGDGPRLELSLTDTEPPT